MKTNENKNTNATTKKATIKMERWMHNPAFNTFASAVEETDTTISGTIGTKLSWEIDKTTKVLTIDNNGAMVSFASDAAPWRNYKNYLY